MNLDFSRIFGTALRYPLRADVFFPMFAVYTIMNIMLWFMGEFQSLSLQYTAAVFAIGLAGWIALIFLIGVYIDNSVYFYSGKRKDILKSAETGKKRFLPLLATSVIIGAIMVACMGTGILIMLLSLASLPSSVNLVMLLGGLGMFLIGMVMAVVLYFMMFLAPVFCVAEKRGPVESVKKSWSTVRKNKLNTLVFMIIMALIYFAVSAVGGLPEAVYTLSLGEIPAVSVQGLAFLLVRVFFSSYLILFVISSEVNYYRSIK